MLGRFTYVLLLIATAGVARAADPATTYVPFPPEKAKAYRASGGFLCGHAWDREVSLESKLFTGADPRHIPSVMFDIDEGKKLPRIPDAGVPFALRLHDDGITDADMLAISKLPNLIALVLSNTKVTDEGIWKLSGSKSLKYIDCYSMSLTDTTLKHLAQCRTLEGIALKTGEFTDEGVKELTNLPNLRYLNLKDSKLTSASLETIAGIKTITHLNLCGNHALGKDLSPLAGMPNLTLLNVAATEAASPAVKSLQGHKTLADLTLSGPGVTDEVFKLGQAFPSLSVLSINASKITDAGLSEAKNIPNLTRLEMDLCTGLTDAGMTELRGLPNLASLGLLYVPITDKGLAELAQIKTLTTIQIGGTKITRAGYKAFEKALPKCQMFGFPAR
ncbi:leucine-rich repeat domain-containing protein [Zavarzinella formosa]|uniref:leucine-rich repeat domain-containing protein n=1 Tax=Zavarzinella formosa TaxID=360055 RepID=UPI0003124166|nr:hypothetical protein [Zavarzinella formosa]